MNRLTLQLELVTPCFLGGADQKAAPEWRAQSIRGQLRWWFRAVAAQPFGRNLAAVKSAEQGVFGSTGQSSAIRLQPLGAPRYWEAGSDPNIGQRLMAQELADLWRLDTRDEPRATALERLRISRGSPPQEVPSNPLQYLGYGCVGLRGLERSCIAPAETARLRILWDEGRWSRLGEVARDCFVRALWCWVHLGGLGSRSRNGWGSLRCLRLDGELPRSSASFPLPADRSSFEACTHDLLAHYTSGDQVAVDDLEWTQVSGHTSVFLGTEARPTWDRALVDAGAWLVAYRRRYGIDSELREKGGRTLAGRDYEWAAPKGGKRRAGLPDRAGFGLPLPFGRGGETVTWDPPGGRGGNGDRRRAAPLLIHVAQVSEGFLPVFTHMPSRFVPTGASVSFKGRSRPAAPLSARQLGIVQCFLDDLASKNLVRRIAP
jgi:CRISPR-associated protein Cmr1